MAYSQEIAWGDGTGDKIYFSAPASEGNQTVTVTSDANAGAERTKTVNFNASGVSPQPLQIVQLGSGGGTDFDAWLKDGDTHLWIDIVNDYQLAQEIRIRMIGTIDWGDGSAKDTANVTAYTTFTHTYSAKGKYRIDLHPTSGTFYLGGGANTYNVMGARTSSGLYRIAALYQLEVGTSLITQISGYAFYYAVGLKRIYIPKTITNLGNQVFSNCYSLYHIEFEDWMRMSGTFNASSLFYNCYSLVDICDYVPNIASGTQYSSCFRGCYSLTEAVIPSATTALAANSFSNTYCLQYLFCLPTAAPTAAAATAVSFPDTCVIVVPTGSLSSYQGASYWSTYSSKMVEGATISFTLSYVTSSNKHMMSVKNVAFTTTLTPDSGKTLGTVTVKMGGTDITSTAYSAGVVTIASVTGNITITATAS